MADTDECIYSYTCQIIALESSIENLLDAGADSQKWF
jgi:hypothetical protein